MIPGRCRTGPWPIVGNAVLLVALFAGTHLIVLLTGGAVTLATDSAPWTADVVLVAAGLLFLGLAFLLPLHAGLINLAIHAQFLAGYSAGALVARSVAIAPGVQAGLGIVAAALTGSAVGALVGWLKRRFAVHEMLSGLLLSAAFVPVARSLNATQEPPPALTIGLGPLATPLPWAPGLVLPPAFVLTWGILLLSVGLAVGLLASHFLRASVAGFNLRTVGSNPLAAVAAGVEVDDVQTWMLVWGGACAGLAGALQLWTEPSVALIHWPFPLGFAGLTVAFLGAGYIRGSLLAALVLAVWLTTTEAPVALVTPGWGVAIASLLVLPALWILPRMLPDAGAPRSTWRTRHREQI